MDSGWVPSPSIKSVINISHIDFPSPWTLCYLFWYKCTVFSSEVSFALTVLLSVVVINLCWVCNWDPKREVKRNPLGRHLNYTKKERTQGIEANCSVYLVEPFPSSRALIHSRLSSPSVISSVYVFLTSIWFLHWFRCLGVHSHIDSLALISPLPAVVHWPGVTVGDVVGRGGRMWPLFLPIFTLWFKLVLGWCGVPSTRTSRPPCSAAAAGLYYKYTASIITRWLYQLPNLSR